MSFSPEKYKKINLSQKANLPIQINQKSEEGGGGGGTITGLYLK